MLLNIFDSVNSLSSFGEQGDIFGLCTSIERLSFEAIQVAETYIFAISVSPEADSVSLFVAPTFCFRQTLKKLRLTLKAFLHIAHGRGQRVHPIAQELGERFVNCQVFLEIGTFWLFWPSIQLTVVLKHCCGAALKMYSWLSFVVVQVGKGQAVEMLLVKDMLEKQVRGQRLKIFKPS